MRRGALGLVAALALAALLALSDARADELSLGDAAWVQRARGAVGGRALPGPISAALRHYEQALQERPESLEARWKLLRALHFAGEFVSDDPQDGRRFFERARGLAEAGLEPLASRIGSGSALVEMEPAEIGQRLRTAGVARENAARLYFWAAINWGAWSRAAGLLRTVREGVANRLHDYARVAMALEPGYEAGGALRLLGRLHATLPRVPFVSGWVDRDRAIPLVERATAIDPTHPGNRLLLALTLLDLAPERRDEALELLARVAALTPRDAMQIEDLAIRDEARERLARERAQAPAAALRPPSS